MTYIKPLLPLPEPVEGLFQLPLIQFLNRFDRLNERHNYENLLSMNTIQIRVNFTKRSALNKRPLNHIMSGIAVTRFGKTFGIQNLASVFQHTRATANHEAILRQIQFRQTDTGR